MADRLHQNESTGGKTARRRPFIEPICCSGGMCHDLPAGFCRDQGLLHDSCVTFGPHRPSGTTRRFKPVRS
jgi:hypothetical protein